MNDTALKAVQSSAIPTRRTSKSVIAGRVITGIALALMTMDVTMKLAGVKQAIDGTVQLGFDPSMVLPLGLIQLACLVLFVIPRTAPLGAVMLTAYLGRAVATHVRLASPMFTHILSPVYIETFLWIGLYLRDPRVRAALGPTR